MKRRPLIALVVLAGLLGGSGSVAPAVAAVAADTGATTRVSVATAGTQANNHSYRPAISADGRYLAFHSPASNLVAGDTNRFTDVFVHDRVTGATTRVSVATAGTQANNYSRRPAISADGRFIAFSSYASNLVAGDTNGTQDVFVHDRVARTTTRVSVATGSTQANGYSQEPAISSDGRYVTFDSRASNLVAGDTNGFTDVFVHDRVTGATARVSVAGSGTQADSNSQGSVISADGRYVAFDSPAGNLVEGDTSGDFDVFVHDRVTGATTRVSVATSGTQANRPSLGPAISADGRYVTFVSYASNLVGGDANRNLQDVFVHDRVTGATTRVDVADGTQTNGSSFVPTISADGRYVAFESEATNLVAGDTNGLVDVFVHDRVTGATTRVDVADGTQANGSSHAPAISARGRHVAFESTASHLVAGDTNGTQDVFVHDRLAAATAFGDFNGNGWSDLIVRQTSTGYLWLYPGTGAGFAARVRIGTGWKPLRAITRFGDMDRDGHEDVIAADRAGALWLYRGTGTGFASRVKIGLWGWNTMREITPVGDLNGDGYLDLIAVRASSGGLYFYPGRGTSFGPRRLIGSGWNAMSELTGVGDVDRDGRVDLVARNDASGALWLYPGSGKGTLAARRSLGTGWNSVRDLVGVGDFDRDGHVDLVAVRSATGKLVMYPGQGTSLRSAVQVGAGWTTAYRPLL